MADDLYHFKAGGREYRITTLTVKQGRELQQVTGRTLGNFDVGLVEGDVDCVAALVWIARREVEPALKFEDVDFELTTFEIVPDDEPRETDEDAGEAGPKPPPDGETEPPATEG